MSKKRRGHRAAILLLLLPLLTAGLRPGTPSPSVEKNRNAGEVYVALGNFLTWSCDARSEELDERARHFNAVQIPLAAAAIDQAERMLQVHDGGMSSTPSSGGATTIYSSGRSPTICTTRSAEAMRSTTRSAAGNNTRPISPTCFPSV